MMVMAVPTLDDALRDIVMPTVVASSHDMVMTAVAVRVDMLVMVAVAARTIVVILGRGRDRDQDCRGCYQGCKARLHRSNLSGCCATKARSAPLNGV